MTPEEFTGRLPPFAGDTAPSMPPFAFRNLSVRVFPLRASLDALQQVCNGYLNIVPAEVGRFRAVVPYTWVALLDYGQVSETEKESIVGWFAQTEVYFGVPVEWYQCVNGRWVFHDWAVISPFIFVDDDISVPLGRTVFGFPKILAQVKEVASKWISDSFAPVTLARVETVLFPELYKGKPLEFRCLLEVERDAPMSNFRIPVDAMNPTAPWVIASKLAEAMAGFGRDAMWMAQTMRISEPNPWMNPAFGVEMLNRLTPAFAPGGHGFTLNSLNLKQFRSSSDPKRISYQALTNGPMQVTAFNGAGPMGEERTALGDLSGGYTIKLYDYQSLPIARTLGLEEGDRRPYGEGVDVITLKPVMPFWANLNVKYLKGTNLAWRTSDGVWRGSGGECLDDSRAGYRPGNGSGGRSANSRHEHVRQKGTGDESWPLFNTTVTSQADEALAGPFEFKGTVIRVLPLLAYRDRLQTFVDVAINHALCNREPTARYKFNVWYRPDSQYGYVYLAAASLGTVTSGTNNVGDWAKYALSFLIPVKRQRKTDDGWHDDGVGVVPACLFVDSTVAAASRTEVLGIPTLRAEFEPPPTVWLEEGRADLQSKQTVLRMSTEVFPALYERQKAAMNPLIEISSLDFAGVGEPTSLANPAEWAQILKAELKSKKDTKRERHYEFRVARALAIELLGNPGVIPVDKTDDRVPVSFYTLKQFRDAADPGKACYQSLVRAPVVFDEILDVCEIEETLRVRIHEFPSLNLVERLGIVAKTVYEQGAGIVYGTQAIRPFYIRANVHELFGERLCWRAGASDWIYDETPLPDKRPCINDETPPGDKKPYINVDLQAARALDNGDPSDIKSFMRQSSLRRPKDGTNEPSKAPFICEKLKSVKEEVKLVKEELESLKEKLQSLKEKLESVKERSEVESKKVHADALATVKEFMSAEWYLKPRIALADAPPTLKSMKRVELKAEIERALTMLKSTQRYLKARIDLVDAPTFKRTEQYLKAGTEAYKTVRTDQEYRFQDLKRLAKGKARDKIDQKIVEIQASELLQASELSQKNGGWSTEYLKCLAEWQFRQGIGEVEAKLAFEVIDPQMVIDAILSREWANRNDSARWRRGKEELRAKLTAVGGEIPFAHLNPKLEDPNLKEPLRVAGKDVADREQEFYENFQRAQENRPGWGDAAWGQFKKHFDPILDRMRDFTPCRVEMEYYRNILSVWSITRLVPRSDGNAWVDTEDTRRKVSDKARKLVEVMNEIAAKKIIGEPSEDDPLVGAVKSRLKELLKDLESMPDLDQELDHGRGWRVDAIRKAAELASQYCDAQRDALFNKLAKASQKPDFCVKRDSVECAATRERYFPISESWDKDWYSGGDDGD